MKKILYIILVTLASVSCAGFDDTAIWDELNEHESRIKKLEQLCRRLNEDISAQQSILSALQEYDYVTGINDIIEDGKVVGYTITFFKREPVSIYHGLDGDTGNNGSDGLDGAGGSDGQDGYTPVIGISKDSDGRYYWTLDGDWIIDGAGNKVPADGADIKDGKDGVIPQLKVENGYWHVSYDNGLTWNKLSKAMAEDGNHGDSFIQSIGTANPDYIVIVLMNGQQIQLPTWKAFEALQTMVNKVNTNISSLQTIVNALQTKDYITGIKPLFENGKEVGYIISFSRSLPVTIYHGKDGQDGEDGAPGKDGQDGEDGMDGKPGQDGEDGKDGADGEDGKDGEDGEPGKDGEDGEDGKDGTDGTPGKDGEDGEDGKDGADGHVPVIGIRKDADGNYYWTINGEWLLDAPDTQAPSGGDSYWEIDGEWLLDEKGNKVPATGTDGRDGATPKLKIENGYWYVSYDGGRTWRSEPLGPATAVSDVSIFKEVSYDEDYLYLTLSSGEVISISRHKEEQEIPYSIIGVETTFQTATFTGHIHVPAEALEYSRVTIYYSDDAVFNVHSAQSVSTQDFDYNGGFSISLAVPDLSKMYHYCLFVESEGKESFGPVEELTTGYGIDVCYENGTFTGKGYYSSTVTSSIINGFALPMLKSHMPESIGGVIFYIRGSENYFQPLTAYVGYMTDPTKANTLKIIKEQTSKAYVTTSFAKVMLPLELSREELAEVPDDGVLYVGFYPPEGYADRPLGCGYISQTDPGYTETMDHKGLYSYQNVNYASYAWAISSSKVYRYCALLVTF